MHDIYLVTFIPDLRDIIRGKIQDKVKVVCLDVSRDDRCDELEDVELAQKIEYAFIDLPLLVKYRKRLTSLIWVHTLWNGIDALMDSFEKNEPLPSYTLTKTSGAVNAPLISNYVIGYVLAYERTMFRYKDAQHRIDWIKYNKPLPCWRDMPEVTMGVLGAGAIGSHKTCKKLGMTVWGLTRTAPSPDRACPSIDVYRTPSELEDFLRNCDYVCAILPSTPETRNILSGDILQVCQEKKPVLLSVGRGDVVDEETIVKAIKNGWLGGAVLDVFNEEPLPVSSPLWTLPGVTITPHVSGWSTDAKYLEKMVDSFTDNLDRLLRGVPFHGAVDWDKGY